MGAETGSLTHILAAEYPDLPILATDISPGMLSQLCAIRSEKSLVCDHNTTQILEMAHPITSDTTPGSFTHIFARWLLRCSAPLRLRFCMNGSAFLLMAVSSQSPWGLRCDCWSTCRLGGGCDCRRQGIHSSSTRACGALVRSQRCIERA